eukprot:5357758-Prymnesium_polylepis.1
MATAAPRPHQNRPAGARAFGVSGNRSFVASASIQLLPRCVAESGVTAATRRGLLCACQLSQLRADVRRET